MQLESCNASLLGKVFLWVNLRLEDETPQAFHQEKKGEWFILDLSELLHLWPVWLRKIFWAPAWGRQLCAGKSSFYGYLAALPALMLWQGFIYVCSAAPLLLPCLKTAFVPFCCCKGGAGVAGWEGEPMATVCAVDTLQEKNPKTVCWNVLNT